jgi:hypothetical protein
LISFAASSALADHPLERQAECLENKTDNLADVIDDNFDDSPDYRFLCRTSVQLDNWAEELDDDIEDGDWMCAQRLASQIACESRNLESIIARQPTCHVPPRAMQRALCLVREVSIESNQLGSAIGSILTGSAPIAGPVSPVGPISPVLPGYPPNPIFQPYPVYRPSWPGHGDPRFFRGGPRQNPWDGTPNGNGFPSGPDDRDDWEQVPVDQSMRRPGYDWNRSGAPLRFQPGFTIRSPGLITRPF